MPEKVLGDFVEAVAKVKPGVPMIAVGISEREMQSKSLSAFVSAFIENRSVFLIFRIQSRKL